VTTGRTLVIGDRDLGRKETLAYFHEDEHGIYVHAGLLSARARPQL
jgi:hypothetical protein